MAQQFGIQRFDVRGLREDAPVAAGQAPRAGEHRHRVGDMLDEVQHQHDVERRSLVKILYSTRHETMARGLGDGSGAVVEVDDYALVDPRFDPPRR